MKLAAGAAAVPMLILLAAAGAMATTAGADVYTNGITTTYTYTLTSDEAGDFITAFHVYAPVDPTKVSGYCPNTDWTFQCDPDIETGSGADIYWYLSNPDADGLAYNDSMQFVAQTSASIPTIYDYVVPGCLGNWGIETKIWEGWGVVVMLPSVAAPQEATSVAPEPGTIMAIATGFGMLILFRRRH